MRRTDSLLRTVLNKHLDGLARTEIRLLESRRPAFRVCGAAGLSLGVGLATALTVYRGLPPLVPLLMLATAALTFVIYVLAAKVITGEESLTLYRQTIAVMLALAFMLRLVHVPVLAYLDVASVGAGVVLAAGRVGCLLVGCCHGRPHAFGVCYRAEHGDAGFAPYLVGVRLFPVQALESLYAFCLSIACAALVLFGETTGEAFTFYVVGYAAGRFNFEFVRGDTSRRFFAGFSEAQWISLALVGAATGAGLVGGVEFRPWHAAVFACLALLTLAVALKRRLRRTIGHKLLQASHVAEIAEALRTLSDETDARTLDSASASAPAPFRIARTSLGIQISANVIESASGSIQQFSFSTRCAALSAFDAKTLAGLIVALRGAPDSHELVEGQCGVFHLLIHARPSADETARPSARAVMEGSHYAV